jgi:hypothetical protein
VIRPRSFALSSAQRRGQFLMTPRGQFSMGATKQGADEGLVEKTQLVDDAFKVVKPAAVHGTIQMRPARGPLPQFHILEQSERRAPISTLTVHPASETNDVRHVRPIHGRFVTLTIRTPSATEAEFFFYASGPYTDTAALGAPRCRSRRDREGSAAGGLQGIRQDRGGAETHLPESAVMRDGKSLLATTQLNCPRELTALAQAKSAGH